MPHLTPRISRPVHARSNSTVVSSVPRRVRRTVIRPIRIRCGCPAFCRHKLRWALQSRGGNFFAFREFPRARRSIMASYVDRHEIPPWLTVSILRAPDPRGAALENMVPDEATTAGGDPPGQTHWRNAGLPITRIVAEPRGRGKGSCCHILQGHRNEEIEG